MMKNDTITAQQACTILGYNARSSLTRLVQAGKITPVFKASGQSGEEFFSRADVQALLTPTAPVPDVSSSGAGVSPVS